MRHNLLFAFLGILLFSVYYAEVPEHAPSLDYKCPTGFQWSRGTIACEQADCPPGVGRTYTYECKCPNDKKCCYEKGLMTSVIAKTSRCPDEIPAVTGRITKLSGDVECSQDGGKTFVPCTVGMTLKQGDFVSTGFESGATLDFGYAELRVFGTTQLRMDELVQEQNIRRTQLYLNIGTVEPRILNHTAAIRSDFSVTTPTAYASIRDSAMKVEYDNAKNLTTVSVTEDKAFVKGNSDSREAEVPQNYKVTVAADGRASQAVSTTLGKGTGNGGLEGTGGPGKGIACCGSIALLLLSFGFVSLAGKAGKKAEKW